MILRVVGACFTSRLIILFVLILAGASSAAAYVQNKELEGALRRSDAKALALLPAKGFRDGAAGFFESHELYVVPQSERAWCQEQVRAVLPPGCYVEFFFQSKRLKERTTQGDFCGRIGRWYRAPGQKDYLPTPGAFYSHAIANDEGELVDTAIHEPAKPGCR